MHESLKQKKDAGTIGELVTEDPIVCVYQTHNYFDVYDMATGKHLTDFAIRNYGENMAHLLAITFANGYRSGFECVDKDFKPVNIKP